MLGENIKRLRDKKGWSQEALAQEAGVSFATILRPERHGKVPRAENLEAIATALGVSVADLYKDSNEAHKEPQEKIYTLTELELRRLIDQVVKEQQTPQNEPEKAHPLAPGVTASRALTTLVKVLSNVDDECVIDTVYMAMQSLSAKGIDVTPLERLFLSPNKLNKVKG